MLVSREAERALVDFCDLPETCLEIAAWFILDTAILDEECEVMLAVFACMPTKVVDVTVEGEGSCRCQLVSEALLKVRLEGRETHTINGILETSILEETL